MICGIGIDSVEINRFNQWHTYSDKQLSKIFSASEIMYCRENQIKSAERFAARFAAREALFKAITFLDDSVPFLKLCKAVHIKKNILGKPEMIVNWSSLNVQDVNYIIWLTFTHTKTIATALVILEI
jgi:holo-[acyl-carrier protein] synthase